MTEEKELQKVLQRLSPSLGHLLQRLMLQNSVRHVSRTQSHLPIINLHSDLIYNLYPLGLLCSHTRQQANPKQR